MSDCSGGAEGMQAMTGLEIMHLVNFSSVKNYTVLRALNPSRFGRGTSREPI